MTTVAMSGSLVEPTMHIESLLKVSLVSMEPDPKRIADAHRKKNTPQVALEPP
tara:strand:- start:5596 stop:5754 length:159 start_codon:yes stop_codon:yes gene_type:complete